VLKTDIASRALITLYQAADVFCLPTYGEGMSNALLEAMAAGLPVISTAVGGHPEAVTDGVEGFLVEPRAIEPLVSTLSLLLTDPSLGRRMGAAGRRRAETIGTSADAGKRLSIMFNKILEDTLVGNTQSDSPYAAALEVAI